MKPCRVYLDWNATAPLRPEAREAMIAAMDVVGNPSSVHAEGRAAKAIVERARGQVALLFGCEPSQVVFTGGATEAASLIIHQGWDLVALGHHAHDCFEKAVVPYTNANLKTHLVGHDPGSWRTASLPLMADWAERRKTLCVVSGGCSETGVVEPLALVVDIAAELQSTANEKRVGDPDHSVNIATDMTQRVGKASCVGQASDFSICSAHKIGGPKGVGAVVLTSGLDLQSQIAGGGQEMGRRSGTENVIGIAGFGAAAEAAARDLANGVWDRVAELRNILEISLDAAEKDIIFVGKGAERLPNTSCFSVPGWKGETQVMQMDLAGFAISAGSACSSGKVKPSRVLRAMGYDEVTAASAIRVSLGPTTTEEDVLSFADAWGAAYKRHKARAA